jgi:ABC-type bacteriocin/lantibiotic exporter with double-glycine peptidase domain
LGIFKLKFSMNFLMNFCSHLQVVAALLIGGWMVHTDQLEVGGVVAFISAVGRLNDPLGRSGQLLSRFEHHPGKVWSGRRQGEPAVRVLVHVPVEMAAIRMEA